MKVRGAIFVLLALACLVTLFTVIKKSQEWGLAPEYVEEINTFRTKAEERLRSDSGWLTVVGLHWLNEGVQTVGSNSDNSIQLPNTVSAVLGELKLENKKVYFRKTDSTAKVFALNQDNQTEIEDQWVQLHHDGEASPTQVEVNDVVFFPILRSERMGLRVKHKNSDTRKNFSGRKWFKPTKEYVITANWLPYLPPKPIEVPDILGNRNQELAPGVATFEFDGQTVSLTPTQSEDELFFVFKDQTSGSETYGAARFLYAKAAVDGKVELDFNKAINPPCAFTAYATCPLPPKENHVKIAIRAGEMTPDKSLH